MLRNNYDDLDARLRLDPDLADRLQAHRDGYGELFQPYALAFGEGFIVEIVIVGGSISESPAKIAARFRLTFVIIAK